MKKQNEKRSVVLLLHYVKLGLRSLLFLVMLVFYILDRTDVLATFYPLLNLVWIFFVADMLLRFFPSKFESMGCQKQFRRNYRPTKPDAKPVNQSWKTTALVAGIWIALNALFGVLYFLGIIDKGILILICLAYSVCDIICILFFCPFQAWFMKNRCCTTCRIYNWDFAMMFTPLIFMPGVYYYSLLGCALILLLRWEITYRRYPEQFSDATNACLKCSACETKLCRHKRRIHTKTDA
ncbi:MAG: hypothetical protein IKK51_08830 [Oscillospiraceae bacterium]|nr:hypothetical protein [Oscillospiraceae bacterium]